MQILRSNYTKVLTRQIFGEKLKIDCKEQPDQKWGSIVWNINCYIRVKKWQECAKNVNHDPAVKHWSSPKHIARVTILWATSTHSKKDELDIKDACSSPGRTPSPAGEGKVTSRVRLGGLTSHSCTTYYQNQTEHSASLVLHTNTDPALFSVSFSKLTFWIRWNWLQFTDTGSVFVDFCTYRKLRDSNPLVTCYQSVISFLTFICTG